MSDRGARKRGATSRARVAERGPGGASSPARAEVWPDLPLGGWQETYATLHLWTQIVGKVRLALSPPLNHWWGTTLYVSPRGLTTSSMPYGTRDCEITFDFMRQTLWIATSDG